LPCLLGLAVAVVACDSSVTKPSGSSASVGAGGASSGTASSNASAGTGGAPNPCAGPGTPGSSIYMGDQIVLFGLESDGTDLYEAHTTFTFGGGGAPAVVTRRPVGGGSTNELANDAAGGLAIVGSSVYYASSAAEIRVVPKTGGPPTTFASDASSVSLVASDGTSVCWVSQGASGWSILCGLAAGGPVAIVLSGAAPVSALQVVAGDVFAVQSSKNVYSLLRIAATGGAAATVATADSQWFYVRGSVAVFWNEGQLWKVPTTGGAPTNLGAMRSDGPGQLVADDKCVYWPSGEVVKAVALAGKTPPTDFAMPEYPAEGIVQDENAIYAIESGSTGVDTGPPLFIERLPKAR